MAADGHAKDVFHHVRDSLSFEVPRFLGAEWHIPQPFGEYFAITKFMVLEVVAALIVFFIFRGLAARIQTGEPVRGRFWNFWETIALFLRDQVVRPTIGEIHPPHGEHAAGHGAEGHAHGDHHHGGHEQAVAPVSARHPADQYLPFIWSIFFFILICNLLGAIPWMGSPTGHLWVTAVFAISALVVVVRAGVGQCGGVLGFLKSLVPHMELPLVLAVFIVPLMWVIEFAGLLIKHGVLAVRLFANIMAGHTVIAVMLGFILDIGHSPLVWVVAPASVFGQVSIGLLELFVAFLQAYVFAYLSTVFIAAALHPH
jgi:F-type H+-transporting ATPase subunit a